MLKSSICPAGLEEVRVEVFVADERPDLTALYIAGQAESLRRHIGDVGLRVGELGDARIVLACDREGRAHGGMRVHLRRPGVPLPVERALGDRCAIGEAVARAPAPLVELCGTWIGASYRGSPLVEVVTRTALAVARSLGARRIVGCAHQYVLEFYRRFGAVVDPELGVHPYPDVRYETCIFWADPNFCADGEAVDADGDGIKSLVSDTTILVLASAGGVGAGEENRISSVVWRTDRVSQRGGHDDAQHRFRGSAGAGRSAAARCGPASRRRRGPRG